MDQKLGSTVAAQFRRACTAFEINDAVKIRTLITVLELSAQTLAQSQTIRTEAGEDVKLWGALRKLWRDLARTQFSFWDNDDEGDEEEEERMGKKDDKDDVLRTLCSSLAKFTRNLVAGVPGNQLQAFENEPDIRRLLHFYTSWSAMEDKESAITARLLTQTLSNTVTANDAVVQRLWESYMSLPEDQVVLIRLLGSSDPKTLLTTLIFILNCIHGSKKRTQLLAHTKVGIRICIALLDNMVRLHEAEEGSEGAKAFDIGYTLVTYFIEAGLVPDLYKKFSMKGEIVTPHQTTLLKLVDSYLQSTQLNPTAIQIPDILRTHESLGSFLAKRFFTLCDYAQEAIHRSLGMTPVTKPKSKQEVAEDEPARRKSTDSQSSTSGHRRATSISSVASATTSSINGSMGAAAASLQELDVMLPKVCEALVLVAQCIITTCLEAEEQQIRLDEGISTFVTFTNMKTYFNQKKHGDNGVVEFLIELLSLLDVFLPRINFGKPVNADGTAAQNPEGTADNAGFSYLKRDLVRLLGVLCHGVQAVQDRVREAGGLPVVMNLCVIDERNPYLREHAIFTLHNLLKKNLESQRFVEGVKPSQEWDEDGTLKTKVGMTTPK